MTEANENLPRAGDLILHRPSGETLMVAYVDGQNLAWCGWPAGEANLSDCEIKKPCTDEEHMKMLLTLASGSGKLAQMAQRALSERKRERE